MMASYYSRHRAERKEVDEEHHLAAGRRPERGRQRAPEADELQGYPPALAIRRMREKEE
jgi:hypothetical protein